MANLGRGAHHQARSRCEAQKPSKPLLSPAGVPSLPGPVPRSSCSCRVQHLLPSVPCSHQQPYAGIPPACGDGQAREKPRICLQSWFRDRSESSNGRLILSCAAKATSVPETLEGAFPRPQTTERLPRNGVRPILSAEKGVEATLAQTREKVPKLLPQLPDSLRCGSRITRRVGIFTHRLRQLQ